MDAAVFEAQRDHAAAHAVSSMIRSSAKYSMKNSAECRSALAVQRMQHGVAGAVGRGAGALGGRAFAEIGGHAAERTLIDLAVLGAAEGHAVMLKLVNGFGRVAAQIFDGVLVAEPVRPLHGVVHVPAPVVPAHIAERGARCRPARQRYASASGKPW